MAYKENTNPVRTFQCLICNAALGRSYTNSEHSVFVGVASVRVSLSMYRCNFSHTFFSFNYKNISMRFVKFLDVGL